MNTQPHNDPLTASLASTGGQSGITGGLFDLPEVVKAVNPAPSRLLNLRSEPTPVTPWRTPLHLQEPFVLREGYTLDTARELFGACPECGGPMRSHLYRHEQDGFLLIHHCAGAFAEVPTCHYRRTP